MADAGLLIGWGDLVRGREAKGLEVFNETLAYFGRLQQDGEIESFDTAILEPHGGDLGGFILLRGARRSSPGCAWTMSSYACGRVRAWSSRASGSSARRWATAFRTRSLRISRQSTI
jgi:hypothetical protein